MNILKICEWPTRRFVWGWAAWAAAGASLAWAQPAPKLSGIDPKGAQRGVRTEMTLFGENLASATGFAFAGDGKIKASFVPRPTPELALEFSGDGIETVENEANRERRIRLDIDPKAARGRYRMRVITPHGVSNAVTFQVGDLPEIIEAEDHQTAESAQAIELPLTINGAIGAEAQSDDYRFEADQGQRLIFDLDGQRIGSALDATLTLFDAAGKEIATDGDANGLDPLLDVTIPEKGDYVLSVRDVRYKGGGNYFYRLHMGELPYLDSIFPLGGRRGHGVDVSFEGRNLGGNARRKLRIAGDATLGRRELRASNAAGLSNARPFVIGESAEFIETEPNNAPDQANAIGPPVTLNGRINEEGDIDVYKFSAEKDAVWIFDVQARRLGSPLDALIALTDSNGNNLAQNDDAAGADSRIEHRFAEAGEYRIAIRDLLGHGGAAFGYRLTMRRLRPDFGLRFRPDNPRIHRGGKTLISIEATRSEGFGGPLRVRFKDLIEGLSAEPLVLNANQTQGRLVLTATEDTALGVHSLAMEVGASMDGQWVVREARPRPEETYLTVMEPAPFTLRMITLNASAEQTADAKIEVDAQRREGFEGEIKLSVQGLPGGVGAEAVTLAPDQVHGVIDLTAPINAEAGMKRIYVQGRAQLDEIDFTAITDMIPFTVGALPFMLTNSMPRLSLTALPEGSESAAGEAFFKVKAERRGWFTGEIEITLEGVPEGIAATIENIASGQEEATITLKASDQVDLEEEISITPIGRATVAGRPYEFRAPAIPVVVSKPIELAGE